MRSWKRWGVHGLTCCGLKQQQQVLLKTNTSLPLVLLLLLLLQTPGQKRYAVVNLRFLACSCNSRKG